MTSPKRVPIFDGHNDVLLRLNRRAGGDPVAAFLQGEDKGHLDLPKARRGGFAGGLFAIFVPSPKRTNSEAPSPQIGSEAAPPAVDTAEAQRVVFAMAALLFRIERESQGRLRVCRTVGDIESCLADEAVAAVLHIEGAEAIDANFELLDVLWESLEADPPALTDEQRVELDYRVAGYEQNPSDVISWEHVRKGLFKKQ